LVGPWAESKEGSLTTVIIDKFTAHLRRVTHDAVVSICCHMETAPGVYIWKRQVDVGILNNFKGVVSDEFNIKQLNNDANTTPLFELGLVSIVFNNRQSQTPTESRVEEPLLVVAEGHNHWDIYVDDELYEDTIGHYMTVERRPGNQEDGDDSVDANLYSDNNSKSAID
jgi:hypothetical protein